MIGASATNAILVATDTLYSTVVFIALTQVGLSFWAQFRAERDGGMPAV